MDPLSILSTIGGSTTDLMSAANKMPLAWVQMMNARKLQKNLKRPGYEIPQAALEALSNARSLASQTELPGQDRYEEQIAGATAGGINQMKQAADSPAAILGGVARMVGGEQDRYADLAAKASEYYAQNQGTLRGQLSAMAPYQQAQWEWNKRMPYEKDAAAISALTGAAMQNWAGGMNDLGNAMGGMAQKQFGGQTSLGNASSKMGAAFVPNMAGATGGVNTNSPEFLALLQALRNNI